MKKLIHSSLTAFAFTSLLFSAGFAVAGEDMQSSVLPENEMLNLQSFQPVGFSCSCHALDQQFEYICKNMSVGTTCGRVGNIICYPTCQ